MTNFRAGDLVTCKPMAGRRAWERKNVGMVVSERPTVVGWIEVLWSDGPCVMPGWDLKLVAEGTS